MKTCTLSIDAINEYREECDYYNRARFERFIERSDWDILDVAEPDDGTPEDLFEYIMC